MKKIAIVGAIVLAVLAAVFIILSKNSAEMVASSNKVLVDVPEETMVDEELVNTERRAYPSNTDTPAVPSGKLKADTFTGILEKVDVGCFADGECFVEVDGKHVTAIMGWSQETVGSIMGVESFGDLESHIGKEVEVYAQDNSDGTYTLYGSEGFYIKVK